MAQRADVVRPAALGRVTRDGASLRGRVQRGPRGGGGGGAESGGGGEEAPAGCPVHAGFIQDFDAAREEHRLHERDVVTRWEHELLGCPGQRYVHQSDERRDGRVRSRIKCIADERRRIRPGSQRQSSQPAQAHAQRRPRTDGRYADGDDEKLERWWYPVDASILLVQREPGRRRFDAGASRIGSGFSGPRGVALVPPAPGPGRLQRRPRVSRGYARAPSHAVRGAPAPAESDVHHRVAHPRSD